MVQLNLPIIHRHNTSNTHICTTVKVDFGGIHMFVFV